MDYKPSENILKLFAEELSNLSLFLENILEDNSEQELLKNNNELIRKFHSLKGGAGFLGYHEISVFASDFEELLKSGQIEIEQVRKSKSHLDVLRRTIYDY